MWGVLGGMILGLLLGSLPAPAATLQLALAQTQLRLYENPAAFAAHMEARVREAMATQPQLIVFPEDIGLPLLLANDGAALRACASIQEARELLARRYGAQIAPLVAQGLSPARALLQLLAPPAESFYVQTFSDLARRYNVYIAAGSAPAPYREGVLANVAYLFAPTGELVGRVGKHNLIELEGPAGLDLTPVAKEELQVCETAFGKIGLIVCADAWDPEIAALYKRQGAQLLVNCLANPEPWNADKEREMDAGSLPARVAENGLPGGQCYAVGRLFELEFQGRSQILMPAGESGWRSLARAKTSDSEEIVAAEIVLP